MTQNTSDTFTSILAQDYIPAKEWKVAQDLDQVAVDALVASQYFDSQDSGFKRTQKTDPFTFESLICGMVEDMSPPALMGGLIVGCHIPPDLGLMALQVRRATLRQTLPESIPDMVIYPLMVDVADQLQKVMRAGFDTMNFGAFRHRTRCIMEESFTEGSLDIPTLKDVYDDIQNIKSRLKELTEA